MHAMLIVGPLHERREVVVGRTISLGSRNSIGRGASAGLSSSPSLPVLASSGFSPASVCWTAREVVHSPQLSSHQLPAVVHVVGKVPPLALGALSPPFAPLSPPLGISNGDVENGVSETTESELDGICPMLGTERSSDFTSDVSTSDGVSVRPACCQVRGVDTGAGVVEWLFRDCMTDLTEGKILETEATVPDEVHPTPRTDAIDTHPSREPSCWNWAGESCKGCCRYCKRADLSSGEALTTDRELEMVVAKDLALDSDLAVLSGPGKRQASAGIEGL